MFLLKIISIIISKRSSSVLISPPPKFCFFRVSVEQDLLEESLPAIYCCRAGRRMALWVNIEVE